MSTGMVKHLQEATVRKPDGKDAIDIFHLEGHLVIIPEVLKVDIIIKNPKQVECVF